jgi:Fibronectin type III domain
MSTVPDHPGAAGFYDVKLTNLHVTWTIPASDGGASIDKYRIRRYKEGLNQPPYVDTIVYSSETLVDKKVTGLEVGTTYSFFIYAHNKNGWSQASAQRDVRTRAGGWIRVGGIWTRAATYVYVGNEPKEAVAFVRSGGIWKEVQYISPPG